MDLSFISFIDQFSLRKEIFFTPSLRIVDYIKRSVEYIPQTKSIIFLLKKYLKNLGLNNYYTGGLSSFSLFLLVFSFYKYLIKTLDNETVNNFFIGQFLIQFLDFYSKFDFKNYIININKEIPFISKDNNNNLIRDEITVILDPFTLNSIASGSFRIIEIQKSFALLKKRLTINYEKTFKIKKYYKKKENSFNSNKNSNYNYNHNYGYSNKNIRNGTKNFRRFYELKELIDTNEDVFDEDEFGDEFQDFMSNDNNNYNYLSSYNNFQNYSHYENFEDFEKDNDLYNANKIPKFVESSISKFD